jgi:hypothetical protein
MSGILLTTPPARRTDAGMITAGGKMTAAAAPMSRQ